MQHLVRKQKITMEEAQEPIRTATNRAALDEAAATALGLTVLTAASGPSRSVRDGIETLGTPLLVTTADHALLQPEWITRFLADSPAHADVAALLAHQDMIEAAAPGTRQRPGQLCSLRQLASTHARLHDSSG